MENSCSIVSKIFAGRIFGFLHGGRIVSVSREREVFVGRMKLWTLNLDPVSTDIDLLKIQITSISKHFLTKHLCLTYRVVLACVVHWLRIQNNEHVIIIYAVY